MERKIVVHMQDGAIHKGITHDFVPERESFHLLPAEGGGVPLRIRVAEMKGLFYVKDYVGNRDFVARRQFDEARRADRRAIVLFRDGEQVWGYLPQDADEDAQGFYFYPSDPDDNNIKIYVVRAAIEELRLA